MSSLSIRNYRLYFLGQIISTCGNWMQQIAIAWLVLDLTHSPFALGVATAMQAAPYLLIGPWGGLLADRVPKQKLLVVTQLLQVIAPLALWALSDGDVIRIWMVYAIAFARGVLNTVDNPARQSFVAEIVGKDHIVNAVSLNASVIQAGRLIGPAIASAVIATIGLSFCFLLNAGTFVFMAVMLLAMRAEQLLPAPRAPRGRGQFRAALTEVRRTPELRIPLVLMAVVGLLAFNFAVVLPAIARYTFHGTATTYALMAIAVGLGALAGAIVSATRTMVTARFVALASTAFGLTLAAASAADSLWLTLVALVFVGTTMVTFSASVQASLQLKAAPEMRGRIMSLYQMLFAGTTPLGAIVVGALAETAGARSGLVLGAVGACVAGCYGLLATRGLRREPDDGSESASFRRTTTSRSTLSNIALESVQASSPFEPSPGVTLGDPART